MALKAVESISSTAPAEPGHARTAQRVRRSVTPVSKVAARTTAPREAVFSQARERDSYAVTAVADIIDRSVNAGIARFTLGLSPAALAESQPGA
jgi:hypothetical protein